MRSVLVTGANGYIGTRLVLELAQQGHAIIALVRSKSRMEIPSRFASLISVVEGDLLSPESLRAIPEQIDAAYYLVHSMSSSHERFTELEERSARNFTARMQQTQARQIIYLSGLSNEERLSRHLASRKHVDAILREGSVPVTTLMAGIIIGSGSASFEIMRDLVEKLPVMVAPRWVNNKVQPIAIRDVLEYLVLVLGHPRCIGEHFEIGGPDVMSYKQLLLEFARLRKLRRLILTVPVLTPNLSSLWLCFITSASFSLSRSLVESLKNNAVCKENRIQTLFPKKLLTFEEAITRAFQRIEEDNVPSSWKDAWGDSRLNPDLTVYIQCPSFGVLTDRQRIPLRRSPEEVRMTVWSLGGDRGWLTMNWAWRLRGLLDRLVGGVGLRRGRTHPHKLKPGDALDFWRVLVADEKNRRLLLYAEMRLPGEAWLEFRIENDALIQTATFRPRGVFGRLYWYLLYPFHWWIFRSMARAIAAASPNTF
jgi:uncharacterized protein YbjT (DUF2867 family)